MTGAAADGLVPLEHVSPNDFRGALAHGRLALHVGPLVVRIQTVLPDVAHYLRAVYGQHPACLDPSFADFTVEVRQPSNLRRWFRRQVEFAVEGETPFEPLPRSQAPALFEWGLNWSIAASCHQWLMVHAACLERGGQAVILPAPPGSGKSTLCAALALRGWRLLSDELTLIDPATLALHGLARPINLKNQSIDLIRSFEPTARWGPLSYDTTKGVITHLAAPLHSVEQVRLKAQPRWLVFPRYVAGADPLLSPRNKAQTFASFVQNAFNYSVLGETGFDATGRLIDACDCFDFEYSRLDDALAVFDWLIEASRSPADDR